MHGIGRATGHAFIQHLHDFRRVCDGAMHGREHVIHQHDHGLTFSHGLASFTVFIFRDVFRCEVLLGVEVLSAALQPFIQGE